jgi:hypothetical protein
MERAELRQREMKRRHTKLVLDVFDISDYYF